MEIREQNHHIGKVKCLFSLVLWIITHGIVAFPNSCVPSCCIWCFSIFIHHSCCWLFQSSSFKINFFHHLINLS
jgi:hypothetical protein